MESKTVFGHLALRFAVHPENLATEALSYILRTSTAASSAFTAFVREIGLDNPGSLRVDTQQGGLEQSIPDMKCFDDTGRLRVVVENKFWAGLTDNQPVTYIHELPAGVSALVLFVVPKARLQLVWNEVGDRCRVAGIPVNDVEKPQTMKAADIGEGHYLAATSWSVLLDALSVAATSAGEIETRNDIAQLQGLCKKMDEEAFLPLRGDELTNLDMAKRIINLSDLPFGIAEQAIRSELCMKTKKETSFRYGAGTYIQIGEFTAWVGFSASQWHAVGVSPIWVNFYPDYNPTTKIRESLISFRMAVPRRCFDFENNNYKWLGVPIFLTTGVEKQSIVEDAVRQIGKLRDELVGQGTHAVPDSKPTHYLDENSEDRPPSQAEDTTAATIMELGSEGGSLTPFGSRDAAGQ